MTEHVLTTAGRAVMRSRLLTPPGPRGLFGVVREAARGGTNPFTLLAVSASRWPTRAALVDEGGPISYLELQSRSESLAVELRSHGVEAGHAVGILCRNGRGFVRAVFAAALVGADVVLLNTDFRTEALSAAISTHQVTTVVCDDEFTQTVRTADVLTVIDPAKAESHQPVSRPKVASGGRIILL